MKLCEINPCEKLNFLLISKDLTFPSTFNDDFMKIEMILTQNVSLLLFNISQAPPDYSHSLNGRKKEDEGIIRINYYQEIYMK